MDLRKEMVIIDNKIVTNDILWYKYDTNNHCFILKYKKGNKPYYYSIDRMKVLDRISLLNLKDYDFFYKGELLKNIQEIYEFEDYNKYYYHIVLKDKSFIDCVGSELKKIDKKFYNVLDYMKKVSEITSLQTEEGKKLLCENLKKVEIDSIDTALANYLKISSEFLKFNSNETLIFPFGCNLSQYRAVENAIFNKISVIEGPPGTGKTQTILNIIANIIIRNMNCQVVSNNNAAIENIDEKLKNYELDFFEALLGNRSNKDNFLKQQKVNIPNFEEYQNVNIDEISIELKNLNLIVKEIYNTKKELAQLIQNRNELIHEHEYFQKLAESKQINITKINRLNTKKLKRMWAQITVLNELSIWHKLKYIFLYGIGDFEFYEQDMHTILNSVENEVYLYNIEDLNKNIKEKEQYIEDNKEQENKYIDLSMKYFKKYLSLKYKNRRKEYSSEEIWKNEGFLNDYPVILSTTYSSRNTLNNNFKFDYIIMDEASQIDVITGTLALSSAKYAVVIGDEKQLPNVVKDNIKKEANRIFDEFNIDKGYSYSINSFLSSIKNILPYVKTQVLVEHYRCHPKIINFCNKKFYNNELAIMSKDNGEKGVVKVIKSVKGNLAHDNASQRQVDIIKDLLQELQSEDIGIIAPYNNQVNLIDENIKGIEVNTVHKFQGRENDIIIVSTVDDKISGFVSDANILNVAISRAKKQLIFIVTGNEIKNRNIQDFIDYVDYNNMEILNSKISSVFDMLYKQNMLERINYFKKHNKVSKFDSENIIYYLLEKVINDYEGLSFVFGQKTNLLFNDRTLLTERENKYISHHNTHIDFCIYNDLGNKPILAIEVDGYKYHKKGTEQYERDLLKNSVLEKYGIPLVRLKTNGSEEEKVIREALDRILN